MEELRRYQIPRKVNAGFRFYGLTWRGLLWMGFMLGVSVLIIFITGWPAPPKIIFPTVLLVGSYYMLTNDFGGFGGFEYLKLFLLHTLFAQNSITLTSSNDYGEPEGRHIIRRIRKQREDHP